MKRKEVEAVAPVKAARTKWSRSALTPEERARAEQEPWLRSLLQLAGVDSNKSGGAALYHETKAKVLELAPSAWRDRIRDIKFKANTKSVHRTDAEEVIKAAVAVQSPVAPAPAAPAPPAPAAAPPAPAAAPPAAPALPPAPTTASRAKKRPNGLDRYFNFKPSAETGLAAYGAHGSVTVASHGETPAEGEKGGDSRRSSCLYTLLDVEPTASAHQIRQAYRQKALQVHPDKGGCSHEFQRVHDAFQLLSDADKRARYDRTHGFVSNSESEQTEQSDAAKCLLAALLTKKLPKDVLTRLNSETVQQIHDQLLTMRQRNVARGAGLPDLRRANGSGLTRKSNGDYQVDVSWCCFRVQSQPLSTVEFATELHCAMTKMRETAKRRIAKALSLRGRRDLDEEEPPLLEGELHDMLSEVPCQVFFSSDLSKRWQQDDENADQDVTDQSRDRWMTRWTCTLSTAMCFRKQARQKLGLRGNAGPVREQDKHLQTELASQEKQEFQRLQEELLDTTQMLFKRDRQPALVTNAGAPPALALPDMKLIRQMESNLECKAFLIQQLKGSNQRYKEKVCSLEKGLRMEQDKKSSLEDSNELLRGELQQASTRLRRLEEEIKRENECKQRIAAADKRCAQDLKAAKLARMATQSLGR